MLRAVDIYTDKKKGECKPLKRVEVDEKGVM